MTRIIADISVSLDGYLDIDRDAPDLRRLR